MKNHKILPSLLIALSALFASCSKENDPTTTNNDNLRLEKTSFSAELPDNMRTLLEDDGHSVKWSSSDVISVFTPASNMPNAFSTTEEGKVVNFTGTTPAGSTKFYAIYPHASTNRFNVASSTFTASLKSQQVAIAGTYADNTSIAVATLEQPVGSSNKRLSFKNATALLKIDFSLGASSAGKQITEIALRANPDATNTRAKLSGETTITAGDNNTRPTTTITNAGQTYITLSGALEPTTGGKPYYMVVPTTTLNEGFTLTFLASDGSAIVKKFGATTFIPNKIKSVNVELNTPQEKYLSNIELIKAIERHGVTFAKEADGRVNYYKNIDAIESAKTLLEQNNPNLTSLDELEYFTNLTQISFTQMPNLAIGNFSTEPYKKLETLVFENTKVNTIDVRGNKLKAFRVENNQALTSIVVHEDHPALTGTNISNNRELTTLDISPLRSLQILNAQANVKIGSFDLSGNTSLTSVNVSDSKLATLDLSNNLALTAITAGGNQLTSIDVSRHTRLSILNLNGNKLQSIDIQNNPELTSLNLADNQISGPLDFSPNPRLESLILNGTTNRVTSLDLRLNTRLSSISIADNVILGTLDLSNNKAVKTIIVTGAINLASITGINALPNLELLLASGAALSTLDISGSPKINNIRVSLNRLTTLDISKNPLLLRVGAPIHEFGNQKDGGTITVKMTPEQKSRYEAHPTMKTHESNQRVVVVTQ